MSNKTRRVAFALTAATILAGACTDGEFGSPGPHSDLAAELSQQPSYAVAPLAHRASAQAAALRIDRVADVEFDVEGGDLVVALRDGEITIVDLRVALGDVFVPADIAPPRGLDLTNIEVELAAAVIGDAAWAPGGESVLVAVTADLVLHWAIHRDGRDIPLGDIRVEAAPLEVELTRAGGSTHAAISASRDGAFWSWANTFELRNLELRVDAE